MKIQVADVRGMIGYVVCSEDLLLGGGNNLACHPSGGTPLEGPVSCRWHAIIFSNGQEASLSYSANECYIRLTR